MNIDLVINHSALGSTRYDIGITERYLPIKLSATSFGDIGECVTFLANDATGTYTDISINDGSVLFIVMWNQLLYDEIKDDIINMDYWSPVNNFHRITGEVDGVKRTVFLDSRAFKKIVNPPKKSNTHFRTINQFQKYDVLFPCIVYVSEGYKSVFNATPIFASSDGFEIKNSSISANVEYELLQYYSYKNDLALKSYTKYYDRYKVTNMLGTQYIIYSEKGFNLLRQYFYDTSEYATHAILGDKVVGAITILEQPAFENTINAITIFLTTEPLKFERCINIDMALSTYEDFPLKTLKPQSTKVLTLAIIHAIIKKYNFQPNNRTVNYSLLGGWNDFLEDCSAKGLLADFTSFFSMDKTKAKKAYDNFCYDVTNKQDVFEDLESFIESNFETMEPEDKALCAFLFPKYKDLLAHLQNPV